MPRFQRRPIGCLVLLSVLLPGAATVRAAQAEPTPQGRLVVQVLDEAGKQSDARVQIYAEGTQVPIATTKIGTPVSLPAGTYRIELDVLGGTLSRDRALVKAGRTSTVILNEVAGLKVSVLDRNGRDIGLGVEVYDGVSGEKLGETISGELLFLLPGMVDIKVATPPQGQWWRQVALQGGGVQELELRELVPGELRVQPLLAGRDVSQQTEVIIYRAGTQKEVARSEPGPEHRFVLEEGAYDVFVGNPTGQGRPFVLDRAEVKGDTTTTKNIILDAEDPAHATPTRNL